jgi:hypothetical protein
VELGQPRADAGDGEHERADTDERELERRDRDDHAEVVAQARHHVDEEPAHAVLEEPRVLLDRLLVRDPEVETIAVPPARLAQAVGDCRDHEPGRADDDERPVPAEL